VVSPMVEISSLFLVQVIPQFRRLESPVPADSQLDERECQVAEFPSSPPDNQEYCWDCGLHRVYERNHDGQG